MNKHNMSAIPDEDKIEELLTKIQPVPGGDYHKKMRQAHWRTEQVQSTTITNKPRLKLAVAVAVLLTISMFAVTPQGRALAQEVVQFFRSVNTTTIPLSEEEKESMFFTPEEYELPLVKVLTPALSPKSARLPECQSTQDARSYTCQIAYAESKLGFDLKELPVQPEGWVFESIYFDAISKKAFTSYKIDISYNSYSYLTLDQGLGENPTVSNYPLGAVPSDRIEFVKIGSYNGEYVKGAFDISNNTNELRWNDSEDRQRLAWGDGTRWFFIDLFANTSSAKSIGRDQLIELAESLVDKPNKTTTPLDPDFLYSISDAEELSGLDLKTPTLLPLGVDFSSAQYLPGNDKVLLRYGINNELVVQEWAGTPTDFDNLSSTSNLDYEVVDINGRNAFFAFSSGTSPYWFLWWSEDEMNYQVYYYQHLSGGGVLNKEKMIAIAESMSDINDSRSNIFKPYDYVAIYEQSLGFDTKEFQAIPVGWLFTNVSADAQPACITVSYTAEKEAGWLHLRQCNTNMDKYFDRYDIPRNAIERVKIENIKGQYIIGNLEFKDSGETIWNSSLPFRILRWQQDGLWMQIVIGGDSTLVYDEEDLITYAESLK
jgi:hypothetical protein